MTSSQKRKGDCRLADPESVASRLWSSYSVSEDGCWEYTKYRHPKKGYGQIGDRRKAIYTHRAAWMLVHGAIPSGLLVLHRCDNPPCFNPEHLFLGTAQDNTDDMHGKGRARKATGLASSNGRLTSDQVDQIRARWVPGERLGRGHQSGNTAQLAADYGVSKQYIGQIGRQVWRKHD